MYFCNIYANDVYFAPDRWPHHAALCHSIYGPDALSDAKSAMLKHCRQFQSKSTYGPKLQISRKYKFIHEFLSVILSVNRNREASVKTTCSGREEA